MTGRQLVTSAAALLLGLLVAVAGVAGATDLAVGAVGLQLAGLVVIMIDVRRRQGDIARRLRLMSQRQETDGGRIRRLPNDVKKDVRSTLKPRLKTMSETLTQSVEHVQSAGEGMVAGLAQERLAAAERHVQLVDEFGQVGDALGGVRDNLGGVQADVGDLRDALGGVRDDVGNARDAVVAKIDETEQTGKRRQVIIREHVDRLRYEPVRQIQALLQLVERIDVRAPLPPTGGWAMEPSTLLRLVRLVETTRPSVVVECGSGASTVWLAYALQTLGAGRVIALEHDERFADQTRQMLDEHGLGAIAEVRTAALTDIKLDQETFAWYNPVAVADLENIGLLVVDGPPRASGTRARYPAVPVLVPKFAAGARIVVDDVDRADEHEATEAWLAETPGLVREGEPVDRAALLVYRPA